MGSEALNTILVKYTDTLETIKHFWIFTMIIVMFATGCKQETYTVDQKLYPKNWKIFPGDNLLFSKISYNDKAWHAISVKDYWENQLKISFDGFAWYRAEVFIPSTLRHQPARDHLIFHFGKIDDCDQFYLNGSLVGENGSVDLRPNRAAFEDAEGVNNTIRRYAVRLSDQRIRWDKVNIIAMRVFDQGGYGGFSGPERPYVVLNGLADRISINTETFYKIKSDGEPDTILHISNLSQQAIRGTLIWSYKLKGNQMVRKTFPLDLNALKSLDFPVSLPISTDTLLMDIRIENNIDHSAFSETIYIPYVLLKKNPGQAVTLPGQEVR